MPVAEHRRRSLLTAALGFLQLSPQTSALRTLHAWLDNWRGFGLIVEGMRRQDYDLQLEHRDARWHVYITKEIHGPRPGAAAGYAKAATPWAALQYASWQVMKRAA